MSRVAKTREIEELINPRLEEMGIELVDIEYRKEDKDQILRIFIDTEQGVDLDTCSRATRAVKEIIDEQEQIYYDHLEVSSPGIERVLKKDSHFVRFCNERIKINTSKPFEGKKKLVGILRSAGQEYIEIEMDEKLYRVPREIISLVRLHPCI